MRMAKGWLNSRSVVERLSLSACYFRAQMTGSSVEKMAGRNAWLHGCDAVDETQAWSEAALEDKAPAPSAAPRLARVGASTL